jgi:hypothetical protein
MSTDLLAPSSTPLVSVVVPAYRRANEVDRALASIREPNLHPSQIQIIVVDNASGDGIESVVERHRPNFADLSLHIWETNVGPIENWRRGIGLAQAPWLKILWSDDQLEERAIERMLDAALRNEARVITCRVAVDYPNGSSVERYLDRPTTLTPDVVISELLHFPAGLTSSPGAALVTTEDALAALEAPLAQSCRDKAIGPDLLITYWGVFSGGLGIHLPDVLARFSAGDDSITVRTPRAVLSSCYVAAMECLVRLGPGTLTATTERRMRSRAALDSVLGGDKTALISPRRLSLRASIYDTWQISQHWFTTTILRKKTI